ncbi:MAG: YCF48-related protein [candidate division KSB1 bacterium]|nr:YCF48-related protein [candidate division KSB1 bacterium]
MRCRADCEFPLCRVQFFDAQIGSIAGRHDRLHLTTNGGETWTEQLQAALSEDVLQDIQFFDRREGYAVGSSGLVLHTQDSGKTWKRETPVPLNCSWSDVHFVDPSCAWAVETHGRVGRYFDPALDPTRVSERETQEAAGLFGEPLQMRNPVRGAATLIYSLPHPAAVHLEIYDLLGRRVRALESGIKGAGTYSILWNLEDDLAHRVPAGTYLCCLRLDGRPFVKKLTVIK